LKKSGARSDGKQNRTKNLYSVARNPTSPLLVIATLGLAATVWSPSDLGQHVTRTAAIQDAEILTESIIALRSAGSEEIREEFDPLHFEKTHPSMAEIKDIEDDRTSFISKPFRSKTIHQQLQQLVAATP
jgi:hypothetical protein